MFKKLLHFLFIDDTLEKNIILLKGIPLFSRLSKRSLIKIALLILKKEYFKNETIYEKYKEANVLYIIKDGQVRITDNTFSKVFKRGDLFGEISLIENSTHINDALALKNSELYLIYRAKLLDLFESDNKIGFEAMRSLASRAVKENQIF